jgi:nitrous oxidase accessory protein NosD
MTVRRGPSGFAVRVLGGSGGVVRNSKISGYRDSIYSEDAQDLQIVGNYADSQVFLTLEGDHVGLVLEDNEHEPSNDED